MSEYLFRNIETSLTKTIFVTRSGTLDIKEWNPWKYDDFSCAECGTEAETLHHFMTCMSYERRLKTHNGNTYMKMTWTCRVK